MLDATLCTSANISSINALEKSDAQQRFKSYLQAIGKGQRSGRTLTQAEAFDAMSLLLSGKVSPEQRGGFLMLLRVREETAQEIAGFLQAARLHNNCELQNIHPDLDMPCYAGKRRHLPWLILSLLCFVQTGKTVFVHGTQEPDTQRLYVSDALTQLGFNKSECPLDVKASIDRLGFAYCDLGTINRPLDDIIKLRAQLGLRTCANTLSRMLNPSCAKASIQGVYHRGLDKRHATSASMLGEPSIIAFRGDAGEVEISPERETHLHVVRDGTHTMVEAPATNASWSIKPRELDVSFLKQVWQGEQKDRYGISATIDTLTIMLLSQHSSVDQDSWQSTRSQAKQLWLNRDKSWPV